jgi:hypothetical protein
LPRRLAEHCGTGIASLSVIPAAPCVVHLNTNAGYARVRQALARRAWTAYQWTPHYAPSGVNVPYFQCELTSLDEIKLSRGGQGWNGPKSEKLPLHKGLSWRSPATSGGSWRCGVPALPRQHSPNAVAQCCYGSPPLVPPRWALLPACLVVDLSSLWCVAVRRRRLCTRSGRLTTGSECCSRSPHIYFNRLCAVC